MKMRFFAILAFVFSVFTSAQARTFDEAADRQILDYVKSSEFSNSVVTYTFNGHSYPIRIVHNPKQQMLWGGDFSEPIKYTLMLTANLPFHLIDHLEELIPELRLDDETIWYDLRGHSSSEAFGAYHPVSITETIVDTAIDAQIEQAFSSSTFVNQIFYYKLKGAYYRVRILYNPEGRTFTAAKNFIVTPGKAQKFTISWDYKYGIITDKPAPQELIDHFSTLANASWWNWKFNFEIYNGIYVEYVKKDAGFFVTDVRTHFLDSWYNFTENLQ